MYAPSYQLNKVRRLIADQGTDFVFERLGTNEYGEPGEVAERIPVRGVYHEALGYVYLTKSTTEATTKRQKLFPMILMCWEDAQRLKHTDQVPYNGKVYKISAIANVGEASVAADVSLSEVQES